MRTSKLDVKDGNLKDAAREAEQLKAFRDTWEMGVHSYLSYLRDRLVTARDLLSLTGSVFVQIGDENAHLVRSLLDEVFGPQNFIRQISARSTGGQSAAFIPGTIDYVLWYARDKGSAKFRPLYQQKDVGGEGATLYTKVEAPDGSRRSMSSLERRGVESLPEGHRPYGVSLLTSQTVRVGQTTIFPVQVDGKTYEPTKGGWKTNREGMARLVAANRVTPTGNTLGYVRYVDDFPAFPLVDIWLDTMGQTKFGGDKLYVVQTANRIIERCMLMTSDPGDLVLDPTCGSGTTAHLAEQWGRRWITIDSSRVALALARQRIMGAKYPYYTLADSDEGRKAEKLPPTITSGEIRKGFVYKRIPHIMLKSIAQNPDIREGMSREEIREAINRHADFELLYDRPEEDKSRVRVAGPFTVESLSPHRSVSFSDSDDFRSGAIDPEAPSFEQSVLANLRTAGIQNGRRAERLEFEVIDDYPGAHVQAVGTQKGSGEQLAIALGPQYGTVSAAFIKNAAREAIETGSSIVAVLGFAFDPQLGIESDEEGFAVVAGVRDLGRVKVLVVRMNVDLLMGEELKKTGSGNLFTVFGEPDLVLRGAGLKWEVEVRGVDVYDPTSGEVRSNSAKEIALWMIDTDYDGENFFVRHAYFLGDNDPYKSLKAALKADIDPDAWATLNSPVSVPFDTPSTGKVAVKVINDYGDEVMKVLEVGG